VGAGGESGRDGGSEQNIKEYIKDVKAQVRQEENGAKVDSSEEALALQRAEQGKGLGDFEEAMPSNDEVATRAKFYHWQDKYRPRKPR
jgi:hypothetical protein